MSRTEDKFYNTFNLKEAIHKFWWNKPDYKPPITGEVLLKLIIALNCSRGYTFELISINYEDAKKEILEECMSCYSLYPEIKEKILDVFKESKN